MAFHIMGQPGIRAGQNAYEISTHPASFKDYQNLFLITFSIKNSIIPNSAVQRPLVTVIG